MGEVPSRRAHLSNRQRENCLGRNVGFYTNTLAASSRHASAENECKLEGKEEEVEGGVRGGRGRGLTAGAAPPHFKGSGDGEAAPFQHRQHFPTRVSVSVRAHAAVHGATCVPIRRE